MRITKKYFNTNKTQQRWPSLTPTNLSLLGRIKRKKPTRFASLACSIRRFLLKKRKLFITKSGLFLKASRKILGISRDYLSTLIKMTKRRVSRLRSSSLTPTTTKKIAFIKPPRNQLHRISKIHL